MKIYICDDEDDDRGNEVDNDENDDDDNDNNDDDDDDHYDGGGGGDDAGEDDYTFKWRKLFSNLVTGSLHQLTSVTGKRIIIKIMFFFN